MNEANPPSTTDSGRTRDVDAPPPPKPSTGSLVEVASEPWDYSQRFADLEEAAHRHPLIDALPLILGVRRVQDSADAHLVPEQIRREMARMSAFAIDIGSAATVAKSELDLFVQLLNIVAGSAGERPLLALQATPDCEATQEREPNDIAAAIRADDVYCSLPGRVAWRRLRREDSEEELVPVPTRCRASAPELATLALHLATAERACARDLELAEVMLQTNGRMRGYLRKVKERDGSKRTVRGGALRHFDAVAMALVRVFAWTGLIPFHEPFAAVKEIFRLFELECCGVPLDRNMQGAADALRTAQSLHEISDRQTRWRIENAMALVAEKHVPEQRCSAAVAEHRRRRVAAGKDVGDHAPSHGGTKIVLGHGGGRPSRFNVAHTGSKIGVVSMASQFAGVFGRTMHENASAANRRRDRRARAAVASSASARANAPSRTRQIAMSRQYSEILATKLRP